MNPDILPIQNNEEAKANQSTVRPVKSQRYMAALYITLSGLAAWIIMWTSAFFVKGDMSLDKSLIVIMLSFIVGVICGIPAYVAVVLITWIPKTINSLISLRKIMIIALPILGLILGFVLPHWGLTDFPIDN